MKKRIIALSLFISLILVFTISVYGGNHHNGGGRCRNNNAPVWHESTEYYDGHYNNQCIQFDHEWHRATKTYKGHYSYECIDYGHNHYHKGCNSGYHRNK